MYKLDKDDDDWSFVDVPNIAGPPRPPYPPSTDKVKTGYLNIVLKDEVMYSVPIEITVQQNDDTSETKLEKMYFQATHALKVLRMI